MDNTIIKETGVKTALVDASSAIILCKTNLLHILIKVYRVVLAESVYHEITALPYSGAEEVTGLAAERKINILESVHQSSKDNLSGLDKGESDTIQLFYAGYGDFIIVDDGHAVRYCKREGVPFINALLFPVVLKYAQIRESEFCDEMFEDVRKTGRYSNEVISFARRCEKKDILFALPAK